MSEAEIAALEAYATRLELSRTAVFSLAVQQELRTPRLIQRAIGKRTHAPGGKGAGRRRVTVHIANEALKTAFAAHVTRRGYGSDEAAWTLLDIELREKTLLTSLGFAGITVDSSLTPS